jgi:hypothetical protein
LFQQDKKTAHVFHGSSELFKETSKPKDTFTLKQRQPVWGHFCMQSVEAPACYLGYATDMAWFCRRKDMHQALRDIAEQGSGEETVHYALGQGWSIFQLTDHDFDHDFDHLYGVAIV